jgi:hypothetical protein
MKHSGILLITLAVASFATTAGNFSQQDFVGVSCSSNDGGKTCLGYGERYENGTEDSCGRIPNGGPEFALKLTYEISGSTVCSTVVETSNSRTMPVGDRFCSSYLQKNADGFTYRFTDDEPTKIRQGYRAKKSDKWCQHLIDAL